MPSYEAVIPRAVRKVIDDLPAKELAIARSTSSSPVTVVPASPQTQGRHSSRP